MFPRVLIVYSSPSPFVKQDAILLAKHNSVLEHHYSGDHPARALISRMRRDRRDFDTVLVWFNDHHAFVATGAAKLLRKRSAIIVGGYDISDEPGYGFLSTARGRRHAGASFRRTDRIVAVSSSIADAVRKRFPQTSRKVSVLHTGVDAERFSPAGGKDGTVLSVAPCASWSRALIKGWDRVAAVARALPDREFLIVGASPTVSGRLHASPNLRVTGPASQGALIDSYRRASVVLHPSRSEGFPNVLLEAMACQCVPVATPVGGMPELVGDAGYLVEPETHSLARAVETASSSTSMGIRARRRVIDRFPLERREEGLLQILEGINRRTPVGESRLPE